MAVRTEITLSCPPVPVFEALPPVWRLPRVSRLHDDIMARMKRGMIDLFALGFAAVVTWALPSAPATSTLDESSARIEAAAYLSAAPREANRIDGQWVVTDGDETAWLDAASGELVEIEFAAPSR